MMRALLLWCQFGLLILSREADGQVAVVEDSVFSPSVATSMKFLVVLPSDYHTTDKRYTTIYLLHGYGGTYRDWVSRTNLVIYAEKHNFLIVTPDGGNSWYTNAIGKPHGRYEDYIVDDLIGYVDGRYRTLSTRHGRVIAGLSMGGFGALKIAVKYPERFYYAASFSGGLGVPYDDRKGYERLNPELMVAFGATQNDHWRRNHVFSLLDSVETKRLPYVWISVGANDGYRRFLEAGRSLAEKLRAKGAAYEYHELPGAHSWSFWDKQVQALLHALTNFNSLKP